MEDNKLYFYGEQEKCVKENLMHINIVNRNLQQCPLAISVQRREIFLEVQVTKCISHTSYVVSWLLF